MKPKLQAELEALRAEMDALRGQIVEMKGWFADLAAAVGQKPGHCAPKGTAEPKAVEGKENDQESKETRQEKPSGPRAGDFVGHIWKQTKMHPDPHIRALMDALENQAGERGDSGAVTYLGVFSSGGRQSSWVQHGVNTDVLMGLIENKMASRVLRCIGSDERLQILLAILRQPRTVAQLVEQCGFNTTGQVYHHLKPLLNADLVKEDEVNRGVYVTQPHRVQGIVMLLAGIADMLDEKYTQGSFEQGEDETQQTV